MPYLKLTEFEIDRFLQRERVLRLGMEAAGERYLLPLGYLWEQSRFVCATSEGRKMKLLRLDPRVTFEIDNAGVEKPFLWTSVTGEGTVEVIAEDSLVENLRPLLFARFADAPEWAVAESRQRAVDGSLHWLSIRPSWMTGRRGAPAPERDQR